MVSFSPDTLKLISEKDPDFAAALRGEAVTAKSQPGAGDVHIATTGKKPPPKKKPLFRVPIDEVADDDSTSTFVDLNDPGAARKAQDVARALKPHADGQHHSPFPYDPHAMDKLEPEQMRRFLGALTTQDDLPLKKVPIRSLVALQPRVNGDKIKSMTDARDEGKPVKPPVVVRWDDKNFVADGHHRLASSYLAGDNSASVRYLSLAGDDEAMKTGDAVFDFSVKKADEDRQMIFGWASIVEKDGKLVVDKQGDVILPEDLEDAAYDFVLSFRNHGDMHEVIGTGRLIESMVFTREKQDALGVMLKNGEGQSIVGWWTGFLIEDKKAWANIRAGNRSEFSIGGSGQRVPHEV